MGLRRTVLVALVLVPLCAASVSASPDWPPPNGSEHSRILAIVTKSETRHGSGSSGIRYEARCAIRDP